jgi:outer membrane protein W
MKIKSLFFLLFFLLLIGCISQSSYAQERKLYLSLFGGFNRVQEYGSIDDYELGENDFPVTSSHTPLGFGMSFGYSVFKQFRVELDARYHMSASITLEDPSDGDHITVDASKHFTITGNIIYQFLRGRFQPYVLAGAGIDALTGVEEQPLTSELGYEIVLTPPEKKTDFVINGGAGCLYFFKENFGLRLDFRYVYIPGSDETPAVKSLNTTIGGVFRF